MARIEPDDWIEVHSATPKTDGEGHIYVLLMFSAPTPVPDDLQAIAEAA